MDRFICIHGHFYQPPRENPWLESIEWQESAYPYHDWNERITAECYAPNAASRILGAHDRIARIVNNYGRISFNFGPTLLAWLEPNAPDVYQAILRADVRSAERFGGHGSALAQAYNHMIMPLANERDRRTQVRWGVADFERRFGRRPDGMWLPETAVDIDTLEALAEAEIRFTILAPSQAARFRPLVEAEAQAQADTEGQAEGQAEAEAEAEAEGRDGGRAAGPANGRGAPSAEAEWTDVSGGRIDTTRAYVQRLPSGRSIALFFYDGPISRAVAFERLLSSGERFAHRITNAFHGEDRRSQLAHIATDGETYGHHHGAGEMALAYALSHIKQASLGRLTNYAQYLELHPPRHEVEIVENTAWSCVHGVGRWRTDCGCNSGGRAGWNQAWRGPLRDALDWLRDELAPRYAAAAAELLREPWAARDDYIAVILDRSPAARDRFLERHARRELSPEERVRVWKLLEMQRQAMLMYTSCGWFFDELSGIETVQVIQYAGRAVQLADQLFDEPVEPGFLQRLERAKSNLPDQGDGRRIYEKQVAAARLDLEKVAAHYAVSSLFETYQDPARVHCYTVRVQDRRSGEAGRARLVLGRATVTSEITEESRHFLIGAVRVVDHTVGGGAAPFEDEASYRRVADEVVSAFRNADFTATMRLMERHFNAEQYSLRSLFRDEQRRVIEKAMSTSITQAEASYRQIYERNAPLMRFLRGLSIPQPAEFEAAAELVINSELRREASADRVDVERMLSLMGEAQEGDIRLDDEGVAFRLSHTMERAMRRFFERPDDEARLDRIAELVGLLPSLPFTVNVWTVQNMFWDMMKRVLPARRARAATGDADAVAWVERFTALGRALQILVEEAERDEPPDPVPVGRPEPEAQDAAGAAGERSRSAGAAPAARRG